MPPLPHGYALEQEIKYQTPSGRSPSRPIPPEKRGRATLLFPIKDLNLDVGIDSQELFDHMSTTGTGIEICI